MLDAKLIAAAIADRSAFERMRSHVTDKDLGPYAKFWWTQVAAFYARDSNATFVDHALLVEHGRREIRNPKHADVLLEFIGLLPDAVSADNVAHAVLELKRHNVGLELAEAITNGDRKGQEELLKIYSELFSATDITASGDYTDASDWDALHCKVDSKHRIPVSPGRLNERLRGGVWPGSHIIVFGRTDMGKSTFAINMSAGFLWSKQRVLYAGDEDNINALKYRMMGRLAMMTPEEIEAQPKVAEGRARERSEDRLLMRQFYRPTVADLERAIEEFEPTVVIMDQIRGMRTKGDGMTQKLEEAGIEVRSLASKYSLVWVSVTQANDRSTKYGEAPPAELGLSDIDSSRTGLPGTADLILGLGADSDMLVRGQRLISFPKNKFNSAKDAKHSIIVQFDTSRSKVQ